MKKKPQRAEAPASSLPGMPPLPQLSETTAAFGNNMGELWKTLSGLSLPVPTLAQMQHDYLQQAADLWNKTISPSPAASAPAPADRRFAAQDWMANPAAPTRRRCTC